MERREHTVEANESLSAIAKRYGYSDPAVLWEANRERLKDRGGPDELEVGDVLLLPDKVARSVTVRTEGTHHFELRSPRTVLRLRLESDWGYDYANRSYQLTVDGGEPVKGTLTDFSELDCEVPADARTAEVRVAIPGATFGAVGAERVWHLDLGHFHTSKEPRGQRQRLENLGLYDPDAIGGTHTAEDELARALRRLQDLQELPAHPKLPRTGTCDGPTREKLRGLAKVDAQRPRSAPPRRPDDDEGATDSPYRTERPGSDPYATPTISDDEGEDEGGPYQNKGPTGAPPKEGPPDGDYQNKGPTGAPPKRVTSDGDYQNKG